MFLRILKLCLFLLIVTGCQTLDESADTPPTINKDTPLDEALDYAIKYGGKTLSDTKKFTKQNKMWVQLHRLTDVRIRKKLTSYSNEEAFNLVHLYQISYPEANPEIVKILISSTNPFVKRLGWQLAAIRPSRAVATILDRELSRAVWDGDEKEVLIPEMAQAASANNLTSIYTLLREGLMSNGSEEFAKAMIQLNPVSAQQDFMDYLALASVDDLRQLNQSSINLYTGLVILRFYLNYGIPLNHPKFEHIFLYSVSRNQALSELANAVVEKQISSHKELLVYSLARLPSWIQIAYVERARRNYSANLGVLLGGLKKHTSHKEVVDEIESLDK